MSAPLTISAPRIFQVPPPLFWYQHLHDSTSDSISASFHLFQHHSLYFYNSINNSMPSAMPLSAPLRLFSANPVNNNRDASAVASTRFAPYYFLKAFLLIGQLEQLRAYGCSVSLSYQSCRKAATFF